MTAVPATTDALLSLLRNASSMTEVRIEDGPWTERPADADVVCIGWTPEEGSAVEWTSEPASLSLNDRSERFTIQGLVSSFNGDADMKAARDRADGLLGETARLVGADPRLGGVVSNSQLSAQNATPYQTAEGAEYAIQFAIDFTVF